MQLRANQLAAHLARNLAALYVIHGDEPLLQIEAADAIRTTARLAGCEERQILIVEPGFKWADFTLARQNLSLFGGRKLIDLRIPSGKPGVDGARALEEYAATLRDDARGGATRDATHGGPHDAPPVATHDETRDVTLITLPRADRATQSAAWFSALESVGVSIATYPLTRAELPKWIKERLLRQGQKVGDDALQFLADRTEGNLLAARGEIEKLGLLLPAGLLDTATVERAIANVARFDVFELSEAWLQGDAGRTLRILKGLEVEGEGAPLVIWQLGEDLHTLAAVVAATANGTPVAVAVRNARVWGKRQAALEIAARRMTGAAIVSLLQRLAGLDALAKGIDGGAIWDELANAALALALRPLEPRAAAFAH